MSAEVVDLPLTQGSLFQIRIALTDDFGSPQDLTNYGIRGAVKNRYSDESPLLAFSPVIVDPPTDGLIDIDILPSASELLPITEAVYDIEKYLLADVESVEKILIGKFLINPEVTT
jgi:hypothetical protein